MDQKTYTKDELVALVDRIGCNSGGEIEVTGCNGGESFSVVIAQTEWYDTPVCFVGGYGNPVAAIARDKVAEKLPGVLALPEGQVTRVYLQDEFWGMAAREGKFLVWKCLLPPEKEENNANHP